MLPEHILQALRTIAEYDGLDTPYNFARTQSNAWIAIIAEEDRRREAREGEENSRS